MAWMMRDINFTVIHVWYCSAGAENL